MQVVEKRKILIFMLIGLITWLSVESLATLITQVSTFVLLEIELNRIPVFYTVQFLKLLFVFLFTRVVVLKIVDPTKELNSILKRIISIYVVIVILKFLSYLLSPILVAHSGTNTTKYFADLKENGLFRTIQFINEYIKILIVVLTIWLYYKQQDHQITSE